MGWIGGPAFLSTAVSAFFAGAVLVRFFRRRTPALLLWALGLLLYAAGTFGEAWHSILGWQDGIFRLWYLCGAMLTAAWLGQGTVYLLLPRRVAHIRMVLLVLLSLLGLHQVLVAQIQPIPQDQPLSGTAITGGSVARSLTPIFTERWPWSVERCIPPGAPGDAERTPIG